MISYVKHESHPDGMSRLPHCCLCFKILEEGEEAIRSNESDGHCLYKWCHVVCAVDKLINKDKSMKIV